MRTLQQINEEKESLLAEANELKDKINSKDYHTKQKDSFSKRIKIIAKRVAFLNKCRNYLEGQPTVDFLKKEECRLKDRLRLIDSEFARKYPNPYKISKEQKAEHQKIWNVSLLKSQLKNIRFIIN